MKERPPAGSRAASLLIQGIPGSLRNKALVSRLYSMEQLDTRSLEPREGRG